MGTTKDQARIGLYAVATLTYKDGRNIKLNMPVLDINIFRPLRLETPVKDPDEMPHIAVFHQVCIAYKGKIYLQRMFFS